MSGYWKDVFRLLSKLTFNRVWNYVLVNVSFYVSKIVGKNIYWGLPYAFSVEPTTSCNLRCPECPSGLRSFTRDTGSVGIDKFQYIIDQYARSALWLTLYFQGEPYLNPNFTELIRYASDRKIYVSTSTNAHYLTPKKAEDTVNSGLDRLIVSIDGTTQETYEQYRIGGSLDKVKEGLKNVVAAKKRLNSNTPYVIIQFLVVGPNEHQIEEIKELGKEYGADEVKLKTAQIYDYQKGSSLIPSNEHYARYIKSQDGTYKLKYELKDECWRMWHSNVVTWDGDVVPCCFDKDAKYVMGNLHDASLKSIWTNAKYDAFRAQLTKDRSKIDICQNCTEGAKIYED